MAPNISYETAHTIAISDAFRRISRGYCFIFQFCHILHFSYSILGFASVLRLILIVSVVSVLIVSARVSVDYEFNVYAVNC